MPELAPLDPNLVLPAAVRRSAERANALHASQFQQPEPAPVAPAPVAPAPVAAAPAAPAPAAPAVTQPGNSAAPGDSTDWKARYHAMEGRWRQSERERERLQAHATEQAEQISDLQVWWQASARPPRPPRRRA
jgi:hypothetical protein